MQEFLTFRTMSLFGSIVTILVAEAATSAGLEAASAPAATAASKLALSTSNAMTCSPFCRRFFAIPLPMLPRPMKPTGPSFTAEGKGNKVQHFRCQMSNQMSSYMTCIEVCAPTAPCMLT